MLYCMRTTLDLDDNLLRQARALAKRQSRTLTSVVEDGLRAVVTQPAEPVVFEFRPVVIDGGEPPLVDLNDRDALYAAMEDRDR
jgi:hypothetical protein